MAMHAQRDHMHQPVPLLLWSPSNVSNLVLFGTTLFTLRFSVLDLRFCIFEGPLDPGFGRTRFGDLGIHLPFMDY
ncbi:hypothetical protein VNO78_06401 [Psophocarpus tetragonolobus]|uniref:Uncharacterized protein n=1 Tax=Psophocarpus tetragonolobus TaxID=3891 RepID=A0AAN9XR38_PSOTE